MNPYTKHETPQLIQAINQMEMTDHLGPQGIQALRDAYNELRKRQEQEKENGEFEKLHGLERRI